MAKPLQIKPAFCLYFNLTFDECEELLMLDLVALHVDLQRQQQSEEELVLLIQAPCSILIHLKGHKLYDVGDAFAGDWAFRGPVKAEFYCTHHK